MAQATNKAVPPTTRNHDILGIYNRFNRFLVEMYKSVSSSVSQMNSFDQARLESYIANIRGYIAHVVGQPQLDLPETSPREYEFEDPPVIDDVESEEVNDIMRLIVIARDELINSQSARNPCNLVPFDHVRIVAIVDKVEAFLNNYVKTLTPIDLPESSPSAVSSGPGRGGI